MCLNIKSWHQWYKFIEHFLWIFWATKLNQKKYFLIYHKPIIIPLVQNPVNQVYLKLKLRGIFLAGFQLSNINSFPISDMHKFTKGKIRFSISLSLAPTGSSMNSCGNGLKSWMRYDNVTHAALPVNRNNKSFW